MAKKQKARKPPKGKKRGPKELVLKITEDPGAAISRFMGSKKSPKATK